MQEKITEAIKEKYSRDLRKQVVKTMLKNEKSSNKKDLESSYNIINQIFSYIISELNWRIAQNTNVWDDTPLQILSEVFPKIETTAWFKNQQISLTNKI